MNASEDDFPKDEGRRPIKIQEKLMAVRLNCSFSFGRVTDKAITRETNSSKDTQALTVRKELLPQESGKNLRNLQSVLSAFYNYHEKVTMSSVNKGERLLPVVFYLDYMAEYGRYDALVKEAFDTFQGSYTNDVNQAMLRLKGAFNANDYPDVSELHEFLRFKVKTLPLPNAETLLQAVGDSIQVDVDSYLSEAVQEALSDVNERIKKALQRMVKQLSDPKGKVYDTLTESLAELVSFVPSWNITADDSLSLLADEIKTKLLPATPDMLRNDEIKRSETARAAAEILRKMGGIRCY